MTNETKNKPAGTNCRYTAVVLLDFNQALLVFSRSKTRSQNSWTPTNWKAPNPPV